MKNRIDLDFTEIDYSDAFAYGDNDLIHRSSLELIREIWKKLYEKAKQEEGRKETGKIIHRCHNAITITASRGAGKTTFLLSVLRQIEQMHGDDVLCLDPIDPSLIEMKQHPFINIIAAIQEHVDVKFRSREWFDPGSDLFDKKKRFLECYKKLLKGLPFIDGVGKQGGYDEWDDEEFISRQGMEKAEACNKLELLFHEYVRLALQILHKRCLVLSFDDIDTDFRKGYEVLEVIRKYLTTSQIVTIITGDLELYGKLVRKASWQYFDKEFLDKEIQYSARSKEEFSQMVNQLENQYLVKLLKPEFRIMLKTLKEYFYEEGYTINVRMADGISEDIVERYRSCIRLLGVGDVNTKLQDEIIRFLMGLTLRVQIRILTLLNDVQIEQKSNEQRARWKMTNGLLNIFWNDINQKSNNTKSLMQVGESYVIEMLKFLLENKALYTSAHFLPETNDFILNKALFAIGSQFNYLLRQKKYLIFDYWTRISYVQVALEKMGGKAKPELMRQFMNYTFMDVDAGLTKSCGLAHAFCNFTLKGPFNEKQDTLPGTIFIGNQTPLHLIELNHILSMIPMVGTVDTMQHEDVFVSIYKLLAVIRDALFFINKGRDNYLLTNLNKLVLYRNYQEPYSSEYYGKRLNEFNFNEDHELLFGDDTFINSIYSFIKELEAWSVLSIHNVSCHFLNRVFTRFYYTLVYIDQSNKGDEKEYTNVAEQFSMYVIALLNATLVEEAIDKGEGRLNYNVIGDIEQIFLQNLIFSKKNNKKRGITDNSDLTLYEWLLKSPLFRLFLSPMVCELIDLTDSDKITTLHELVKYDRVINKLEFIDMEISENTDKLKNCNQNLEWMKNYYALKDIEEERNIIVNLSLTKALSSFKINERINLMNRLGELSEKKQQLLDKLQIKTKENSYSFRASKEYIDDWHMDEEKRHSELVSIIDNLKADKESLEKKRDKFSDFVKKDYEVFKMKMRRSSYHKQKYSVYDILSKISLR